MNSVQLIWLILLMFILSAPFTQTEILGKTSAYSLMAWYSITLQQYENKLWENTVREFPSLYWKPQCKVSIHVHVQIVTVAANVLSPSKYQLCIFSRTFKREHALNDLEIQLSLLHKPLQISVGVGSKWNCFHVKLRLRGFPMRS